MPMEKSSSSKQQGAAMAAASCRPVLLQQAKGTIRQFQRLMCLLLTGTRSSSSSSGSGRLVGNRTRGQCMEQVRSGVCCWAMEGQWLDGEAFNEKVVCQQSCGAEK